MEQTEKALFEKGKEICEIIDQLISFDKKFLIERTKAYCKYCLSLNKDEVNSICNNFYEECEDYLEKLESNLNNKLKKENFESNLNNKLEIEQFEKQFITCYESTLAKEGKEICKEVETIIGDNDELMIEKAHVYCNFFALIDCEDKKLVERCKDYLEKLINFSSYKNTFKKVNNDRRERKRWLDMKNM